MKFSTVAKVAVEITDLKAENAKLRGFVKWVAKEWDGTGVPDWFAKEEHDDAVARIKTGEFVDMTHALEDKWDGYGIDAAYNVTHGVVTEARKLLIELGL